MNLHGYLAKNKIGYESEEAKDFANIFFMMMNYYSIERSMEIAKNVEKHIKILINQIMQVANILIFIHHKSSCHNLKSKRIIC